MTSPVSAGDIIAIAQVCITIERFIRNIKNSPVQYENSLNSLQSMYRTFLFLSEVTGRYYTPGSSTIVDGNPDLLQSLSTEIKLAKAALEEGEKILKQRYARPKMPFGRFKRKLRWPNTRCEFEKCLGSVHQRLYHIHAMLGASQS